VYARCKKSFLHLLALTVSEQKSILIYRNFYIKIKSQLGCKVNPMLNN